MGTYVLVGGFWLGAWAWRDTAATLRARGHEVFPVTLTGLGDRSHLGNAGVDLDTHVTDVVRVLEVEDLHDVTLVGHSYAGFVVSGVADRVPERLGRLLYVDSGPLGDGVGQLDFLPPEGQEALRRQVDEEGDGWGIPVPGTREALGDHGSTAGLDGAAFARFAAAATPHPFGSAAQPLRLCGPDRGGYGRGVVLCSDGGISVAAVRAQIAAGEPGLAQAFADPDWDLADLPTGHWPMLTVPQELADVLTMLAAGGERPR